MTEVFARYLLLTFAVAGCTRAADPSSVDTIPRARAESIALAKVSAGRIVEGELEAEGGRLVWSFDVETAGTSNVTEVQVDAKNGAIVSVSDETPADQVRERN